VDSGLSTTPAGTTSEEVCSGPGSAPRFLATWSCSRRLDKPGAHYCLRPASGRSFSAASCPISRADLSPHGSSADTGPSRFPQSRPCGVLRSARYPCRHHQMLHLALRAQQRPRVFRFSVRLGAYASTRPDLHPLGSGIPSTDFPGSSLRLRGWHFPLTFPGPVVGPSHFPQSRLCGVLWSARYPCQHHPVCTRFSLGLTAPRRLA